LNQRLRTNGVRKTRVRISDIAEKCNLSISTVSIVLRNKPGIPVETRQRVLQAAEELGYPLRARSPLHEGRITNQQVGVLMKSMPLPNVFYSDVLAGIDAACNQYHLNLMFTSINCDNKGVPMEMPRMLQQNDCDGYLMLGTYLDEGFEQVRSSLAGPIVLVDGYSHNAACDSVVIRNVEGAYQATTHLIDHGHRHIAIAGSMVEGFPGIVERRTGFLKAMQDHDLPALYFADSALEPYTAVDPLEEMLVQNPQITAVYACTDEIAMKAIEVANRLGRRVPEDISVAGFDDIAWSSRSRPALTTMHIDRFHMGHLAIVVLLNRLQYREAAEVTVSIHPQLIERESVAGI